MNEDLEHLKLLSIFHYIVGGLVAFISLFPIIHIGIGVLALLGRLNGTQPAPAWFGWIFIVAGSLCLLTGMAIAVCMALAGRRLVQRRSHTFCMVVASLECLFMPFGTILGVFTLIVLNRESVKKLFASGPPVPPPA